MSSTTIETITIVDADVDEKAKAKATADESKSKSKSSASSKSLSSVVPGWLDRLNEFDEAISTPVFCLGLPKWVELVFSVPACFFGMSFTVIVGPLWIAILGLSAHHHHQQQQESEFQFQHETGPYGNEQNAHKILLLQAIAVSITFIYVAAWGGYQVYDWKTPVLQLFWNWKVYVLASPWNAGVLAYTVLGLNVNDNELSSPNTKAIVSMALYPLTLFPFMFLLLNQLKERSRRSRPAKKDKERQHHNAITDTNSSGMWTRQKSFPAMTHILAEHDGHKSFPSGDVACAALIAIPIYTIDEKIGGYGCQGLAIAIVVLSALGRMYVLAHHFLDVLAGASLSYGIHKLATAVLGYGMLDVEWWHPVLVWGVYFVMETWKKRKGEAAAAAAATEDRPDSKND